MKAAKAFRGLTCILSLLLAISIGLTSGMFSAEGHINRFLGIETTVLVPKAEGVGQASSARYPSSFSADIAHYTAEEEDAKSKAADEFIEWEIEESAVLLRNNNHALPLTKEEMGRVSLFGRATVDPYFKSQSGGGEGGAGEHVDYLAALGERGFTVNETLLNAYRADQSPKTTYEHLGESPASVYTDDVLASFKDTEVAIVMFSRMAGESHDLLPEYKDSDGAIIGMLELSANERDMMTLVKKYKDSGCFKKIIVLLNTSNAMEVDWLDTYGVDACMWIGGPGNGCGFRGVADLLTGASNPSGRLTDTYATSAMSAPAMMNFRDISYTNGGNYVVYAEDIYVGYRYYETRYEDAVLGQGNAVSKAGVWASADGWNYADEVVYPFGYGLSYTTFTQKLDKVEETDGKLLATVTVTNTGDTAGKAVIELYAQTPYGDYEKTNLVEKSAIQLVAFDKTKLLAPGASETRQLEVDKYFLTAYDSHGAKGYILSEGTYYLSLGDDAHDALNNVLACKNASGLTAPDGSAVAGDPAKVYTWTEKFDDESYRHSVTGQEVTNRFDDADINYWQSGAMTYLSRQDWEGTYPKSLRGENALTRTENMVEPGYVKPADAPSVDAVVTEKVTGLKLQDMWGMEWESNYWDELVDELSVDELISLTQDSRYLRPVETIGFPQGNAADGPDGVPNGNAYANFNLSCSSWNTEVLAKRGDFIAEDCMFQNVQFLWGPGFNVHRTPYSGRNFEYVSEDSCLAYKLGAANIAAMQAKGLNVGIKHFFANDQETHRSGLDTFATEQTLREICMRMFEGAFVEGHTLSTMLGTNNIGITSASQHKGSLLDVLRGEWGFKGLVITDACGGSEGNVKTVETIAFGANVFCFSDAKARSRKIKNAIIVEDDGALLNTLKERVKETLYAYANSNMMNCLTSDYEIVTVTPWWKTTVLGIDAGIALLTIASFLSFLLSWKKLRKKERNA